MKEEKATCAVCGEKNIPYTEQDCFNTEIELYPDLCPSIEDVEKKTKTEGYQRCPRCGYVARWVGDKLGVSKDMVESEEYQYPFGEMEEREETARYYRMGLVYQKGSFRKGAAKYYIRAAALAQHGETQNKCYRKAWLCLSEPSGKIVHAEEYLAYLNLMRLMKMFKAVKDSVIAHYDEAEGINRTLMEKLFLLSEQGNDRYMTYMEMLAD